jgi:hypothetical protein
MAKIQYIAPSPKAGQIEHVRPDTARTLVAAGFAIDIPYKDFRARLADAGAANDPHNVNPCVEGVQWGVKDANESGFGVVAVVKRFGSETTWYSTPPEDAPESIKRRYRDLTNTVSGPSAAAQLDAAKRKQLEYDHSIKDVRRY